jgi:hypothetical protein
MAANLYVVYYAEKDYVVKTVDRYLDQRKETNQEWMHHLSKINEGILEMYEVNLADILGYKGRGVD